MDIEEFYEADERRRRSEEVEIGTEWNDARGARYEVSWVADTGEIYVMREPGGTTGLDFFGDGVSVTVHTDAVTVLVVGWIADRARVEQVFDGWQAAMAGPDGISWLSERLRQQAVPRQAPA
jgi:hypothetical protein